MLDDLRKRTRALRLQKEAAQREEWEGEPSVLAGKHHADGSDREQESLFFGALKEWSLHHTALADVDSRFKASSATYAEVVEMVVGLFSPVNIASKAAEFVYDKHLPIAGLTMHYAARRVNLREIEMYSTVDVVRYVAEELADYIPEGANVVKARRESDPISGVETVTVVYQEAP